MSDIVFTGKNLPSQHINNFNELLKKVQDITVNKRPYNARVTSKHPTAFIFMLDQSGSMENTFSIEGEAVKKSDYLSYVINQLLSNLIAESNRDFNFPNKPYFDICIVGYGGDSDNTAKYAWQGALKNRDFVKVSDLVNNYVEKDGEEKIWIMPKAEYQTPMKAALELCYDTLVKWLTEKDMLQTFPPIVFNITDGEASDAAEIELIEAANKIKDLKTADGNVILFNIHLGDAADKAVSFPCNKNQLFGDDYAKTLFDMSSPMPQRVERDIANWVMHDKTTAYMAMCYNTNPQNILRLLNIGTSISRENKD